MDLKIITNCVNCQEDCDRVTVVGVVGPTSVELKEEYLAMGSTREQPKAHLLEVEQRVWGTGTDLAFGAAGPL